MKKLSFTKMTGAGNDFIIIDAHPGLAYKRLAKTICDRTNGLGADGLLIYQTSRTADYHMRIINADGSEAEMCGNGARCMAAYIQQFKKPSHKRFSLQTLAGIIMAEATQGTAMIRLSEPTDYQPNISLTINQHALHADYIDTGVPHAVIFVTEIENIDVQTIGHTIRFHKKFQPRGTNVNFVEPIGRNTIAVRTYERGVEGETKACGTGSAASAIVTFLQSHRNLLQKNKITMKVKTRNSDILEISFDIANGHPTNVWLKGPATLVAQGTYFIDNA